jgi:RNA polymerase sigma-70 factor (ECF subfamily)
MDASSRSLTMVPRQAGTTDPHAAHASDADLAAAIREGNADALGELYRRYSEKLMAVAYRLLWSRDEAEDVLHDVFVGLPKALRKYDERGRLEPWLRRVTAHVALSRLRAGRVEFGGDPDSAADEGISLEESMTLRAAVASLAPSLRAVLVLKEIEGFSHAEIGAMLGISKGASEVRLHRAIAALRERMTRDEKGASR